MSLHYNQTWTTTLPTATFRMPKIPSTTVRYVSMHEGPLMMWANNSAFQYPTSSRDHQPTLLTQATDAQSAATTAQNHPVTQSIKDTVANGPVADMAKEQHAKTASEFSNLANSRTTPDKSAATGQPLTHYHSFFYNLLSVSGYTAPHRCRRLTSLVGKPPCYDSLLRLHHTFHLRCSVSPSSPLVLQSSIHGTRR